MAQPRSLNAEYLSSLDELLFLAVVSDDFNQVQNLVKNGANVNCYRGQSSENNQVKIPLIHLAVAMSTPEIVTYLIEQGVNIHALDHRNNNVWYAVIEYNKQKSIPILIENKVNYNHVNSYGISPLCQAAQRKDQQIFNILIKKCPQIKYVSPYEKFTVTKISKSGLIEEFVAELWGEVSASLWKNSFLRRQDSAFHNKIAPGCASSSAIMINSMALFNTKLVENISLNEGKKECVFTIFKSAPHYVNFYSKCHPSINNLPQPDSSGVNKKFKMTLSLSSSHFLLIRNELEAYLDNIRAAKITQAPSMPSNPAPTPAVMAHTSQAQSDAVHNNTTAQTQPENPTSGASSTDQSSENAATLPRHKQ